MKSFIYADNAATTRIADEVLNAMLPYLQDQYGNASSQYSLGVAAKRAVQNARFQFASALNAAPDEIFFTSGGSESDNWAISGSVHNLASKGKHIITTAIEHHAVLNTCAALEKQGFRVTYLPVDRWGKISLNTVREAIEPETILISVMLANNEIGTIQPVAEIARIAHDNGILCHTDAVQAVGHIPVDVSQLDVDMLSLSSHKFYGPKGVGVLYKKKGSTIGPLIYGGQQESGQRAGTENTAGIVGAGAAIEMSVSTLLTAMREQEAIVTSLIQKLKEAIPGIMINGHPTDHLPGILSVSIDGCDGEALMNILDMKGICVSTGSACTSGSKEPSHVLMAIGATERQAHGTIRLSFGKYNTIDQVQQIADAIIFAFKKTQLA